MRGWRHLRQQGGVYGLIRRGRVVLRDGRHRLTRGGHLCSGATRELRVGVGRRRRHVLRLRRHVLVRESRGHLLVGLGHGRRRLRCRGGVRMHLALRGPLHGAGHHLRVVLGPVARRRLVAVWELGPVAVLLMRLQLTREHLLVVGRDAGRRGRVSVEEALRRLEVRVGPGLVPLRHRMPDGLRVRLLLRLGRRALNGHSWLGHELGVGPHLRGHGVASRGRGRDVVVLRRRGVARDRGLDARHGARRGPDWDRSREARLGGLRGRRPVTRRRRRLVWHLRMHVGRHLGERSGRQRPGRREVSDPRQELRRRQIGREASETAGRGAGPRQRAAAAQVSGVGDEDVGTGKTSRRGGSVRGEAAELFG